MKTFALLVCLLLSPQDAAVAPGAPSGDPTSVAAASQNNSNTNNSPANGSQAIGSEASSPSTAASSDEHGWLYDLFHTGAMKYMLDGGIFMWPILLLGVWHSA